MAFTARRFIRPGISLSRSRKKLRRMPVPKGPGVGAAPRWYWASKSSAQPLIDQGPKKNPFYPDTWVYYTGVVYPDGTVAAVLYQGKQAIAKMKGIKLQKAGYGNVKILAKFA